MLTVRRMAQKGLVILRCHHNPDRAGFVRAPRTSLKGWNERAAKAERRELSATTGPSLSLAGYHRCHGETRGAYRSRRLKSVLESSVRIVSHRQRWIRQRDSDRIVNPIWSVRLCRRVVRLVPSQRRPGLPGEKPIAYSTTNPFCARGNLQPNAGPETPGTPPSPVTFRRRGRAFAVVRARESRAHGEGRQ